MLNFSHIQSNNSAELTGKLEAEQHSNKDVAAKLSEIQINMEETKLQVRLFIFAL